MCLLFLRAIRLRRHGVVRRQHRVEDLLSVGSHGEGIGRGSGGTDADTARSKAAGRGLYCAHQLTYYQGAAEGRCKRRGGRQGGSCCGGGEFVRRREVAFGRIVKAARRSPRWCQGVCDRSGRARNVPATTALLRASPHIAPRLRPYDFENYRRRAFKSSQ